MWTLEMWTWTLMCEQHIRSFSIFLKESTFAEAIHLKFHRRLYTTTVAREVRSLPSKNVSSEPQQGECKSDPTNRARPTSRAIFNQANCGGGENSQTWSQGSSMVISSSEKCRHWFTVHQRSGRRSEITATQSDYCSSFTLRLRTVTTADPNSSWFNNGGWEWSVDEIAIVWTWTWTEEDETWNWIFIN